MTAVAITEFNDPGCPFGFSAEPVRHRLRWVFGDQLSWTLRLIVLADTRDDYAGRGLTADMVQGGQRRLAAEHGMPIDSRLREAVPATAPACRTIVAARLSDGAAAERRQLRALRLRYFGGGLLDDPALLHDAAADAGLDADQLLTLARSDDVTAALDEDKALARHPTPEALAQDHKLAGWDGGRRYTCPSYELRLNGHTMTVPGFQPFAAYEVALANLAPGLERRAAPDDVAEVLNWAGYPLATAEVAAICAIDRTEARERLVRAGAHERPSGSDGYWSL